MAEETPSNHHPVASEPTHWYDITLSFPNRQENAPAQRLLYYTAAVFMIEARRTLKKLGEMADWIRATLGRLHIDIDTKIALRIRLNETVPLCDVTSQDVGSPYVKAAYDQLKAEIAAFAAKGGEVDLPMRCLQQILHNGLNVAFPLESKAESLPVETVERAIRRARTLEKMKTIESLPSPDDVAFALYRLADRPEVDTQALVDIVSRDMAISDRLLQRINSPYYGRRYKTDVLVDAVTSLGQKEVYKIALGVTMLSHLKEGPCIAFDYHGFWSRSVARAVAANHLAENLGFEQNRRGGQAFTAGLLSKLGMLILATGFSDEYAQILTSSRLHEPDLQGREAAWFGLGHNHLGAEWLAGSHLSKTLCAAIRYQDSAVDVEHQELSNNTRQLSGILGCAGELARVYTSTSPVTKMQLEHLLEQAVGQGIAEDTFGDQFDCMAHSWQDMGAFFEVPTQRVLPWHTLLKKAV